MKEIVPAVTRNKLYSYFRGKNNWTKNKLLETEQGVGVGEMSEGGQRVQASSYENMMCSIVTTVNIIVLYIWKLLTELILNILTCIEKIVTMWGDGRVN